jgi:hypothetical protein
MTEYGAEPVGVHGHVEKSPISLAWVILASLLCGGGLFLIWFWLTTFDWLYFSGIALAVVGGLMFFNHRAGLDHA